MAVINFVHLTFMIVRGFFCSSPALKKNLSVQYRLFYAHNLIAMAIEIDLLNEAIRFTSQMFTICEKSLLLKHPWSMPDKAHNHKEHSRIPYENSMNDTHKN